MNGLRRLPVVLFLGIAAGCNREPVADGVELPPPKPQETHEPSAMPPSVRSAMPVADSEPLHAGHVTFQGMVRPVKGGYDVRGVVLDEGFGKKLLESSADGIPADPDWFLGAVVRVTAELVEHVGHSTPGGLAEQTREGSWLSATKLETVELVANAVVVEGKLGRSKGLFTIDKYLVTADDLAWSLVSSGGGKEGDRVKLWGQPRTHRCAPDEQCLTTGSLLMFDVGRAAKLP